MYSYGPPHMAVQKQNDQHEHTFSSYVRIRDVVLKTYLERWTIGRSGERGSGISVLPARHDDDDDDVMAKSSTYRNFSISVLIDSVMLLILRINSVTDKILPWGTPVSCLYMSYCKGLVKKEDWCHCIPKIYCGH